MPSVSVYFVVGLIGRNRDLQHTSLWMFTLTGLLTLPTYLSGRPARYFLSKLMPGMSMDPSDRHAEIAVIALTLALLLAVAAGAILSGESKTERSVRRAAVPPSFCSG